jgi:WD40 repeat protein
MSKILNGHIDWIQCLIFSSDEKYLFSGANAEDKMILMWNTLDGSLIKKFAGHNNSIRSL